jgi:hypothetical protein
MKKQKLGGFTMGEGAMREEGAQVEFEFPNCTATFWIRALDGVMLAKLAAKNVVMGQIANTGDENFVEWMARNASSFETLVNALVVKFEGLKRSDGSVIECSPETITGLAGYPPLVSALIRAGYDVAQELEKNSDDSSDGGDTLTASDDGPNTGEHVLNEV